MTELVWQTLQVAMKPVGLKERIRDAGEGGYLQLRAYRDIAAVWSGYFFVVVQAESGQQGTNVGIFSSSGLC